MSKQIEVIEVGPRDGFQSVKCTPPIPTEIKLDVIDRLVAAGVKHIEYTSFVSPKAITPPFCSSVFMAQKLSGARYVDIIKEVMPFVVASLIVVILTTYCPALSTFIPNMVAGAAA